MDNITGNEPIYPGVETDLEDPNSEKPWPRTYSYGGMTLLQLFAGQQMASMRMYYSTRGYNWNEEEAADLACRDAQALIRQLNRYQQPKPAIVNEENRDFTRPEELDYD